MVHFKEGYDRTTHFKGRHSVRGEIGMACEFEGDGCCTDPEGYCEYCLHREKWDEPGLPHCLAPEDDRVRMHLNEKSEEVRR